MHVLTCVSKHSTRDASPRLADEPALLTPLCAGLCRGLDDGDALTIGSRQPLAAVGSSHRSVHRAGLHR